MLTLAAWVLFASAAGAPEAADAPIATTPVQGRAAVAHGHRTKPAGAPPAREPAKITLELRARARLGPWAVRLVNSGDVPLRTLADVRFLSFDVTARGERRAVRCELPGAMRPGPTSQWPIVLPPQEVFVLTFNPRLYCFGGKAMDALEPGAIVVAHLGWPDSGPSGPTAVSPLDDAVSPVGPLHSVDAPPIALPDDPSPELGSSWPHTPSKASERPLSLASPATIDAPSAHDIAIPLTLRNEGSSPVTVRFRPDTLGFDVIGPGMTQRCDWPVLPGAPMPELYATVAPHGSMELTLNLLAYCDDPAFEHAGLYSVRAWLDTRKASGNAIGVRSFDDVVVAHEATLVRVQQTAAAPRTPRSPPGDTSTNGP